MKKIYLFFSLLAMLGLSATAQESISVNEVLVPNGKAAMMEVMFHFNEGHDYVSYQFTVNLPNGISLVTDGEGYALIELGEGQPSTRYSSELPASSSIMKAYSSPSTPIAANDGVLVCIPVQADENIVSVGDELEGSLTAVEFTHNEGAVRNPFADVNFTIKITDKIILDENYSWTPFATSTACDLTVKRTIKAGEWSTLCLPFAMSVDKLKAAFGDDYELAAFTDYEVEKESADIVGLTLNFTKNTSAAKINTPYVIKVSQDVSEFNVNAKLNPGNPVKEIIIEDDETGDEINLGSVAGTYKARTIVPQNSLFLSGNKFYYSAGKTKMKAFRAYFSLTDVLAEAVNAGARINMSFGEATGIKKVNGDVLTVNGYYDLQGRKVEKPVKRGVYIQDGKKVIIK